MIANPRPPEESPSVPAWIVTFSDLSTNLLTFFVLLLSLGAIRDDSLFDSGNRVSYHFLQSVKTGFGFRENTQFDCASIKYPVDQPELPRGVSRDVREQRTRRLFATLQRSMQTRRSPLPSTPPTFHVAVVRFAPGETALDDAGQRWVVRFGMDLQQSLDPATSVMYVVGVVGPQTTEAQTWLLAARRARAVADSLRQVLAPPTAARAMEEQHDHRPAWQVFWWGAGPGSDWEGHAPLQPGQSQVLIAILRRNN